MNLFKNISEEKLKKSLVNKIKPNINKKITPGKDYISVSGKVLDSDDILYGIDATIDSWLTSGRYTSEFEKKLTSFIGSKNAILVNSGSSANLLSTYASCNPLRKNRFKREEFGDFKFVPLVRGK